MLVLCNLYNCLHNKEGMCLLDTVKIKDGTCTWLINNPDWHQVNTPQETKGDYNSVNEQ